MLQVMLEVLLLWGLIASVNAQGQGCVELQTSDLGSTSSPTDTGLLAIMLAAQSGDVINPTIQILESNNVCLAQASVRDLYRYVSVLVRYLRFSGGMAPVTVTAQVEYECIAGEWGFSRPSVDFNSNATLTSLVRTDCNLCIGPATAPASFVLTDIEHCFGMLSSMHSR